MQIWENGKYQDTHNSFVDDLKLYTSSINVIEIPLDSATIFFRVIGKKFPENSCIYLHNEKRGIVESTVIVNINQLTI